MATNNCNKSKPCGCEDQPYASLPPCNPIDCPDPIVCSEVINAQCVVYTGNDITCGQVEVVLTNDTVATALQNIVDYICNIPAPVASPTFVADIQPSLSLEWGLQVDLTNGTAPFTYQWSYAQNGDVGAFDDMRGILFSGSTTAQNVALTTSTKYYTSYDGEFSGSTHSTHVKVRVTDANGQIADAYYVATRFFAAQ